MDGLFFDSETVYAQGWKKALDYYQIDVSDQFIASLKGQGAKDNDQAVYAICRDKELVKKVRQMRSNYFFEELRKGKVNLCYYALEMASQLKENGYQIALASSSVNSIVDALLASQDLLSFFDYKISGNQVESVKPAPDIYLKTLEQANCLPSEAIAFEDSVMGVQAALNAGVQVCFIDQNEQSTGEPDVLVFKNLHLAYQQLFS